MEQEIKFSKESAIRTIAELKDKVEELTAAKTIEVIKEVEVMSEVTITNSEIGGDIGGLAKGLSAAQSEFKAVAKNSSGHGYEYLDIAGVLDYAQPIYTKYGVAITQMNVSKMMGKTPLVGVKTIIMHEGGGYISGEVYIPVFKSKMNSTVQMAGVAITYLRRYGLQSALGLATTDSDGTL